MNYQKMTRLFFSSLALLFILALTACNAPFTQQGATPTSTPNTYGGDGVQKGPGSVALTATARATPVAVVCQLPPLTLANTGGWQTYTDKEFPFHISLPIGWKVGQTTFTEGNTANASYEIMVLPPTGYIPIVPESVMTEPEYISLTITLTGPSASFSNQATWTPEAAPILVNHVATKLYHRFSPDCGELNRSTDPVTFGNHPYSFYQESRSQADKAKDSQIFLSIIQSFAYTGAK